MVYKDIHLEKETREKILEGVLILSEAVGSTLGPMGSNVIIETPYGATTVTKDGVTVAKHIDLDDAVQNLGAQVIKQASTRTGTTAGDGTSTSVVLAAALLKDANKLISAGIPPINIKRRFEDLLLKTLNLIHAKSRPVDSDKIREIATISANNDETIGELIQEAYNHVGSEGLISLEESKTGSTYVTLEQGVSIDKGFASPYFVTDSVKGECVLDNPLIFITDAKIRIQTEIIPIMELAAEQRRSLLIIADEIDSMALQTLVLNKMRGAIQVAAINAPSFGDNRYELLKDLAALTSSKIHSAKAGTRIDDITSDYLGSATKVVLTKSKTVLISPEHDVERVESRAKEIKGYLETETEPYLRTRFQKRLADLTANVAVLFVGGATETEIKEKKDRVDDALRATACAIQKGYLIGGGVALARIATEIKIEDPLIDPVFISALSAPLKRIATNAGMSGDVVLERTLRDKDFDTGYNARTNKYTDLLKDGVIDPALVVEQTIVNAVSAANMLILSSVAVTNKDRKPPFSPGNLEDYAA